MRKTSKAKTVYPRITIRITPHLEKIINEVALIERRNVSDFVRLVVLDHCTAKLAAKGAE